jgi:pimeloyl-ACP methyl ester carboxylesterase
MPQEYTAVHTQPLTLEGVTLETAHWPGPSDRAPLVFLHEGLGSVGLWRQRGQDWPGQLCAASGRAGVAWSRRGYGQSDPIPDVRGATADAGFWRRCRHAPDYMHREALQVLPRLLAAWGLERPVLVGHSDGATIALLHASRYPVSACIAMAPHVFVEDVALQAIAQARDAYARGLRDKLARYHRDVDNAFWQWNDVWLSPAFAHFDMRAECHSIGAPLLLVQGLDDEYGTLAQLEAIASAAPQAQCLTLPACGHSPHRDQPEALTQAMVAFLATLP